MRDPYSTVAWRRCVHNEEQNSTIFIGKKDGFGAIEEKGELLQDRWWKGCLDMRVDNMVRKYTAALVEVKSRLLFILGFLGNQRRVCSLFWH